MFCTVCDALVQQVFRERGLDPFECDVHCGFDGGQGLLKIALTVTQRLTEEQIGHQSHVGLNFFYKTYDNFVGLKAIICEEVAGYRGCSGCARELLQREGKIYIAYLDS